MRGEGAVKHPWAAVWYSRVAVIRCPKGFNLRNENVSLVNRREASLRKQDRLSRSSPLAREISSVQYCANAVPTASSVLPTTGCTLEVPP